MLNRAMERFSLTREDRLFSSYIHEISGVTVLHMTGTMTYDSLKEIDDTWDEQLKKRPEVLALNLKGVEHIDSITINHLFNLSKKASMLDVKLIICDVSDELKSIFDVIGIERAITVMDNKKFHAEYIATSLATQENQ